MPQSDWLRRTSPAFQLMIATSWIAPESYREIQDNAVQQACNARPNWTEYLHLIDRHRTPAISWAALKRTPDGQVPEQVQRELQKRSDVCRWQAMRHLKLLVQVLKGLNQCGIPAMPLKGPLLSLALYGDAGLRQSKDLDILVPQSEIPRAQSCVESMGWRLGAEYFPLTPRQWKANLRYEQHVGYTHPHGGDLELHWQWYGPQQTEQYWSRSRTSERFGFSYWEMIRPDLAIYLCQHGGVHQWMRAKWVGDLTRLHCSGSVDWTEVLAQARILHEERPVLLGLQLLSDCYALTLPNVPSRLHLSLPDSLVRSTVCALTDRREPFERTSWEVVKEKVRTYRYNRMLWPHGSWWGVVFTYRRLDFKVLRLPDSLFWLYIPLRPFLWLWRRPGTALWHRVQKFRQKFPRKVFDRDLTKSWSRRKEA